MESGYLGARGALNARVIRAPGPGLAWRLRNTLRLTFLLGLWANWLGRVLSRLTGIPVLTAELRAILIRADGSRINYGVVSRRLVTNAFVEYVVDNLIAEVSAFGDFKYHDSGVGTTAEDEDDTGIETTDGEDRVTGTQVEGANPNQYVSVGTISYTTTKAITEHGLFNAASSGVLMDRSVFSAINVENGDSIQFTYTLTFDAESA